MKKWIVIVFTFSCLSGTALAQFLDSTDVQVYSNWYPKAENPSLYDTLNSASFLSALKYQLKSNFSSFSGISANDLTYLASKGEQMESYSGIQKAYDSWEDIEFY